MAAPTKNNLEGHTVGGYPFLCNFRLPITGICKCLPPAATRWCSLPAGVAPSDASIGGSTACAHSRAPTQETSNLGRARHTWPCKVRGYCGCSGTGTRPCAYPCPPSTPSEARATFNLATVFIDVKFEQAASSPLVPRLRTISQMPSGRSQAPASGARRPQNHAAYTFPVGLGARRFSQVVPTQVTIWAIPNKSNVQTCKLGVWRARRLAEAVAASVIHKHVDQTKLGLRLAEGSLDSCHEEGGSGVT